MLVHMFSLSWIMQNYYNFCSFSLPHFCWTHFTHKYHSKPICVQERITPSEIHAHFLKKKYYIIFFKKIITRHLPWSHSRKPTNIPLSDIRPLDSSFATFKKIIKYSTRIFFCQKKACRLSTPGIVCRLNSPVLTIENNI